MEPGSEEPGDQPHKKRLEIEKQWLQWSRAPKSPVTISELVDGACIDRASMEPGSEEPGDGRCGS